MRSDLRPFLGRLVVAAPDRLVLALFWVSLVVTGAILAGAFHPWLVLPLVLVVLVATWRLTPTPLPVDRAAVLGATGALLTALAFVALHQPYASRFVVVNRDPGFLTLGGMWLSRHPEAVIPVGDALAASQGLPAYVAAGGHNLTGDVLQVQGANLLPGLLGGLGWVGGDRAVMSGNLLLGALALLALYGTARRVVGPVWGLVPTVALACSMPLGAFARSAYTEPLSLALAFGGLTVLWNAFERRSPAAFALGGAMVGATALARIDGAATVIGLIAAVCLAAAGAVTPTARRHLRTALFATAGGGLALTLIGYLDLRVLSSRYLADLGPRFSLLAAALVVTTVVGLVLAVPRAWDPLRRRLLRHKVVVGRGAVALTVAVAAFLTSRPLWDTPRHLKEGSPYSGLVAALQAAEGLEVDPLRSYDENTVLWISWYHGWPTVALAFAGVAVMAWLAFARRDPRHLLLLGVIGAPSVLYLYRVSITPDQIWAVRRLLPITIPGFLLAATIVLAALWASRARWRRAVAVVLAGVVALTPLATWGPMFRVVEHGGRYDHLVATCAALPADRVVYLNTGQPFLASLATVCGVEVIEFRQEPTRADLATIHARWGAAAVVAFAPDRAPWVTTPLPVAGVDTSRWPTTLTRRPDHEVRVDLLTYVGVLTAAGEIVPVEPAQDGG